jgi:DNA-binding NtrC family response regulator
MNEHICILVIDDEQVVLESVRKHLRDDGYAIHTVLSAEEGLALLDRDPMGIDIVLTDLMMPHIDGLELMKSVKARFPNMPVILITGYATINTAVQAKQQGAFGYVAKPFSKAELKTVVHEAVTVVRKAREAES